MFSFLSTVWADKMMPAEAFEAPLFPDVVDLSKGNVSEADEVEAARPPWCEAIYNNRSSFLMFQEKKTINPPFFLMIFPGKRLIP